VRHAGFEKEELRRCCSRKIRWKIEAIGLAADGEGFRGRYRLIDQKTREVGVEKADEGRGEKKRELPEVAGAQRTQRREKNR